MFELFSRKVNFVSSVSVCTTLLEELDSTDFFDFFIYESSTWHSDSKASISSDTIRESSPCKLLPQIEKSGAFVP